MFNFITEDIYPYANAEIKNMMFSITRNLYFNPSYFNKFLNFCYESLIKSGKKSAEGSKEDEEHKESEEYFYNIKGIDKNKSQLKDSRKEKSMYIVSILQGILTYQRENLYDNMSKIEELLIVLLSSEEKSDIKIGGLLLSTIYKSLSMTIIQNKSICSKEEFENPNYMFKFHSDKFANYDIRTDSFIFSIPREKESKTTQSFLQHYLFTYANKCTEIYTKLEPNNSNFQQFSKKLFRLNYILINSIQGCTEFALEKQTQSPKEDYLNIDLKTEGDINTFIFGLKDQFAHVLNTIFTQIIDNKLLQENTQIISKYIKTALLYFGMNKYKVRLKIKGISEE